MQKIIARILAGLLVFAILAALVPVIFAEEEKKDQETVVDPASQFIMGANYEESFRPNEDPKQWSITPDETGEYLLYLQMDAENMLLHEIEGQTSTGQIETDGYSRYYQYALTAGQTYQLKVWLNPEYESQFPNGSKLVVSMQKLQPLQSLILSETTAAGVQGDSASLYVDADPYYYPLDGVKWESSDSSIIKITETDGRNCHYTMMKVGTATITASLEGKTVSCTITVEKQTGEWDSYEIWPDTVTEKTITIAPGMAAQYTFTPVESGKYVLYTVSGESHAELRQTNYMVEMPISMIHAANKTFMLYDLTAGETYILAVAPNPGVEGSISTVVCLEKARNPSKVNLYGPNMSDVSNMVGYVGGQFSIYAETDPLYSFGLSEEGFVYTSSDPSVATVTGFGAHSPSADVVLVGPGTCTITVQVGGKTAVCRLTVKASPVLKAGETTKLELSGEIYGVTCLFTPEKTGTYKFTMKGSGGTGSIEGTGIGTYFEGSGSMSGKLEAGKTYKVNLFIGGSDHTITVSGSGGNTSQGGSEDPTQGTEATQPTGGNDPTQGTEPPVSTEPTQGATEPGQGTDAPTVNTDPTQTTGPAVDMDAVAEALGGQYSNGTVTVEQKDQTGETVLTQEILDALVRAGASLQVQTEEIDITLDANALTAIAEQIQGEVTLKYAQMMQEHLSDQQRAALEGKEMTGAVTISLFCGSDYIHDFRGGQAAVSLPFQPEEGKAGEDYQVYYLSPEGEMEKMDASCTDGKLTFRTGHFSEYVILYEPAQSNPTGWIIGIAAAVLLIGAGAVVIAMTLRKKVKDPEKPVEL